MDVVLDFDGTVYGPSVPLKNSVVPLLRQTITEKCQLPTESFEDCRARLFAKHGTKSLFMAILLETGCSEAVLLENTYIRGMHSCGFEMRLREGISQLLLNSPLVTILTNAPISWVEYLSDKLGIATQIEGIFGLSQKSLIEKPSHDAFLSVSHDDIVFVDDIYGNCVVAEQLGWKSFWFPEEAHSSFPETCNEKIDKISSAEIVSDYLRRSR